MNDYKDLGLNQFLQPLNAPVTAERSFVDNLQIDSNFDFPLGKVNFTNMTPGSRAYTAVISLSREQGTFDDIQEALNYVNRLGGGRILVLPGTYTISKNLTIYADTSMEGLSAEDCVFDFNSTSFNLSLNASANYIHLNRLTFKNCQNTTNGTIYINNNYRAEISDCIFADNRDSSDVGYDIYASSPRNLLVTRCLTDRCGTFYYSNSASRVNEVSNCDIRIPKGYAFYGDTTPDGGGSTLYRNNLILGATKSIFFGGFIAGKIEGNHITFNTATLTQPAIDVDLSPRLVIADNMILADSGGHSGIEVTNSSNVIIRGNSVFASEANAAAIKIATNCSKTIINGNTITNSAAGSDGIKIDDESDQTIISGNYISGGSSGTSYGVNIAAASCNDTLVVANWLFGNTADTLDNGTGSTISTND